MYRICSETRRRAVSPGRSRRDFLKASAATGAAASLALFGGSSVSAAPADPPQGTGRFGRRYVIRGGHVMSMDAAVGDFAAADVLVEGQSSSPWALPSRRAAPR